MRSGDWIQVGGGSGGQSGVSDELMTSRVDGLSPDTIYAFRIRAVTAAQNSIWSPEIMATTLPEGVPAAPTELRADTITPTSFILRWTDNSDNELGFAVLLRGADSEYSTLATTTENSESFAVTGLTPDVSYSYRVRAFSANETSEDSESVEVTTPSEPDDVESEQLLAPTNLSVTPTSSESIRVAWTYDGDGKVEIERADGNGQFERISTVPSDIQFFDDQELLQGMKYSYRLRVRGDGPEVSSFSPVALAITPLPAPTNLRLLASYNGNNDFEIAWDDNSTGETDFITDPIQQNAWRADANATKLGFGRALEQNLSTGPKTFRMRARTAYTVSEPSNDLVISIGSVTKFPSVGLDLNTIGALGFGRISTTARTNLTVGFDVAGTAVEGVDYVTLPRSITIPSTTNRVTLPITILDNPLRNATRQISVALTAAIGFHLRGIFANVVVPGPQRISGLSWKTFVPATPAAGYQQNTGIDPDEDGFRIYPDKLSPTDANSDDRSKVSLEAWVGVPGAGKTVYFRIWDADDPALGTAVDPNDVRPNVATPVPTADDNRRPGDLNGIGDGFQDFQAVVDNNGIARVDFKVTLQPGNNFRAFASVNVADRDSITVDKVENSKLLPPSVSRSPLLTVFRKLYIERDSMSAPQGEAFAPDDVAPGLDAGPINPEIDEFDSDKKMSLTPAQQDWIRKVSNPRNVPLQ
jgi:hypothetical protein